MGLTVVGNLLHVSSYQESNIIHTECWSIVGWTTHKTLPFCSGPTSITSCSHRKDTRFSSHIHNFAFQTRRAWEWGYSFGTSNFSWSSPWYQTMEWSHWLCHDDVMVIYHRSSYGWRKCQVNIQGCNEWIYWVWTWTPSPPPSPCEWTHTVPVEKIITFVSDIVNCACDKHVTSRFSTAQPISSLDPVLSSGKVVW